jgi:hypothetical protein
MYLTPHKKTCDHFIYILTLMLVRLLDKRPDMYCIVPNINRCQKTLVFILYCTAVKVHLWMNFFVIFYFFVNCLCQKNYNNCCKDPDPASKSDQNLTKMSNDKNTTGSATLTLTLNRPQNNNVFKNK